MMNAVAKSGNLAPYLKNTSQAAVAALKCTTKPVVVDGQKTVVPTAPSQETNFSLNSVLSRGKIAVQYGPSGPIQYRLAHTDIKVPDFTYYRKDCTKDPNLKAMDTEASRKNFTYLVAASGFMLGTYAAKNTVHMFLSSMSASADVLAMASIEVKLSEIPEGKSVTFKWRGKPLFIRHRTAAEVAKEEAVNLSQLRDPEHDSKRVQKPQWLVVLGVCTHLGCVPIANSGDFGGYYCPCHGSHYDASGRIRKGPAPLNLEVPPYEFTSDDVILVG